MSIQFENKNVIFGAILFLALLGAVFIARQSRNAETVPETEWVLHDSASANLTGFDPIQIVDATTLNTLANCYEGLVVYNAAGEIVPGLAERWDRSDNGLVWTFHLKPNIQFHPWGELPGFKHSGILSAEDVVYSLGRCVTAPTSFNGWWLGDLVDRDENGNPKITATSPLVVSIHLKKPYALLNRLVSVAGWIYPAKIDQALGSGGLAGKVVGTGPYRLTQFVPDDQIVLERWEAYAGEIGGKAPSKVVIRILSDRLAALESYRSGNLDMVELNLDILEAGRALAKRNKDALVSVPANHLDYFCMNLERPPYNDPDLRMALALSIDRQNLVGLFKGLATPAYGFTPPTSGAYQGEAALQTAGFRYNPVEAKRRFHLFLSKTGAATPMDLKLVYDGETMPELAAQYFKDSVEKILPVKLQLEKITWPELMQNSFGGTLGFHRLWWLVATPSEDVYFQFYMPGKSPPAGINISRYGRQEFSQRYDEVFSKISEKDRMAGIRELEQMLITDAVAIPLWHGKPEFMIRKGITVPIASTLRKFYAQSSNRPQ